MESEHIKTIRAAKGAAQKLTETERILRERHAVLTRDRQKTWSALASRGEVLSHASRLVETAAARWRDQHAPGWVRRLSGSRETRVDRIGTSQEREREIHVPPRLPEVQGLLQAPGALSFDDLCGLAPEIVTQSLHAMIQAQPDDRFGLPEDARAARLAELDAEMAAVESQHSELVDAAAECGIELSLLKSVAERREAERIAGERERALQAERERAGV